MKANWPYPTRKMQQDPEFDAVWKVIKEWDIYVPGVYHGYCGATGNHVRAILDAIRSAKNFRKRLMKKETFQGHVIQPIQDVEGHYSLEIDGKIQMAMDGSRPRKVWKFVSLRDCINAGHSIVDAMEMNR